VSLSQKETIMAVERNAAGNKLLLQCECGYKLYSGKLGDLVQTYVCWCDCGKLLGFTINDEGIQKLDQDKIAEWLRTAPTIADEL
jgi:hypothetical protein